MTTIHFKALDTISGKTYFSKDFTSLREFFNHFDNVQHSIQLISRGEDIARLVEMEEKMNGYTYETKEENKQQNHSNREFNPFDLINKIGSQVFTQAQTNSFRNVDPNKKNNDINMNEIFKAAKGAVKVGKMIIDSQNKKHR